MLRTSLLVVILMIWMLAPIGCMRQVTPASPAAPVSEPTKPGFDVAGMDTNVSAADDFYHYAVGTWIKENPVPDDQKRWSAFNILREQTRENVKTTILKAADITDAPKDSIPYKVGTFYQVGMDEEKIQADGFTPIKGELSRIEAIQDLAGFHRELAHMTLHTSAPLFYLYVAPDEKNATMNIAAVYQGGIGLPDRDYYVEEDDRSKEIRTAYVAHVARMMELIGSDQKTAQKEAETVMAIETRLAAASNTRVENRNPKARYNKMTIEDLKARTPDFDWQAFFAELGVTDPGGININQPRFIEEIGKMVKEVSLAGWKTYLKWTVLRSMAPTLSDAFVNEHFAFNDKFMNGQAEIKPRWKRVVDMTNRSLGEAVGQLYVADYFPPEAKDRAMEIVANLLIAMGERIDALDWMSNATKAKAKEKLSAIDVKMGYPDKWKDLTELEVKEDSYAANVMRANHFDLMDDLKDVNKPVDKAEWYMTPQTVNAGYSPSRNDMTFPAGILQFPFFDKDVDDAINYGAMGAVIGHEITHGFDDQGRQYDKDGNLEDWWTPEDEAKFKEKTKALVAQYNAYAPFEGFHVNGEMTLGENIADLGGLLVAYQALTKTEQFKTGTAIDGFTPSQRFFLSWAQVWKTNIRDDALKTMIKIDVHSPARYRVRGPLANINAFFEAFEIKPGDPMHKKEEEVVRIW
ncbi:MAG: M13 family metallopeptidase [Myxococcota bacterium]|nr:M13 family metallopeptidase [Myxococcota bacterium]